MPLEKEYGSILIIHYPNKKKERKDLYNFCCLQS